LCWVAVVACDFEEDGLYVCVYAWKKMVDGIHKDGKVEYIFHDVGRKRENETGGFW
jgi:hypothetical protein